MDIAFTIEPDGPATVRNQKRVFYIVLDPVMCRGVAIPDTRMFGVVEFDIKPGFSGQALEDLASAAIYGPSHDKTLTEIVGPNPSARN